MTESTPAGAMPVVASATLAQSYPVGPWWAPYRLPFGVDARGAGVCFEGEGGATPPPPAAPPAVPPAQPPAAPPATPPATGDPELGDAGRRAIAAERAAAAEARAAAKAAQDELAALKAAGQTDQEKALAKARQDASVEERNRWQAHIRSSEVRSHLRAAGLTNEKALALAAGAPEFSKLKVNDEGSVEQVAETVEAFKKDYPELFAPAVPGGGAPTRGPVPGAPGEPKDLESAVAAHYSKR